MWKPAAAVIIVTMAGATAHAQQQQSPIENLDKTISELAQEGYEVKAAENLSGDWSDPLELDTDEAGH